MTYAKLHILTSIVVNSCNSCLFIFIHVIQLSFSCMFIILFSYLLSVHIVYMHELLPLHTHSLGRFLTTLNLHVQILDAVFLLSGVRWDGTLREELELFPIRFQYSHLSYLHIIPDSRYISFSCYSSSWFIWYHAWVLICDIAVTMIYYSFNL